MSSPNYSVSTDKYLGQNASTVPSTEEVRNRLSEVIQKTIQSAERRVIRSPTGSGKTHAASTTPWKEHSQMTGDEPVVILSGSKTARRQAAEKSEAAGIDHLELLGRVDACALARGDYDAGRDRIDAPDGSCPSAWFHKMMQQNGIPASAAHARFVSRVDDPAIENHECQIRSQWDEPLRDADTGEVTHDVVHATHQFAQSSEIIENTNVVIDERPDFSLSIDPGRADKTVTAFLDQSSLEVRSYKELVVNHVRDQSQYSGPDVTLPDIEWFHSPDGHALAPAIVEAMLAAKYVGNDRFYGETRYEFPNLISGGTTGNEILVRVVIDNDDNLAIVQKIPEFEKARSVVGLDACPTQTKWCENIGQDLEFTSVLSPGEEQNWRRHERNLRIKQLGDDKYPWTQSGFSESVVRVLCGRLREKYGTGFNSAITSFRYEQSVEDILHNSGISNPVTMHYNHLKSRDDFETEEIGLVAGCISPSADQIKDWLALCETKATPRREEENSYSGQEWVGEGASIAHQVIADVREKGVLQAAGRYARSPADPDDGATVYVLTNVLGENNLLDNSTYVDEFLEKPAPFGDKKQAVIDRLYYSSEKKSAAEVVSQLEDSVTKRYVRTIMNDMKGNSCVEYSEGDQRASEPDRCKLTELRRGSVEL